MEHMFSTPQFSHQAVDLFDREKEFESIDDSTVPSPKQVLFRPKSPGSSVSCERGQSSTDEDESLESSDVESVLSSALTKSLSGTDSFSLLSPRSSTPFPVSADVTSKATSYPGHTQQIGAVFQDLDNVPEINVSFSGAALCGFYFNGICQQLVARRVRIGKAYGASAGALSALSLLLGSPPECHEEILHLYDQQRESTPWILLKARDFTWESEIVNKILLPIDDPAKCRDRIEREINGKLHVAVTRVCGYDRDSKSFFPTSVMINEWHDRQDLIDCIRASMSFPGVTCMAPFYWRGAYWADGGLLNNQPLPSSCSSCSSSSFFDPSSSSSASHRVITVSPMVPFQPWQPSWGADVDVFRHFPLLHGVLHTSMESRRSMFEAGVSDARVLLSRLQTIAADSDALPSNRKHTDTEPDANTSPSSWQQRRGEASTCSLSEANWTLEENAAAKQQGPAKERSGYSAWLLRPLARLVHFAVLEAQYCCPALRRPPQLLAHSASAGDHSTTDATVPVRSNVRSNLHVCNAGSELQQELAGLAAAVMCDLEAASALRPLSCA